MILSNSHHRIISSNAQLATSFLERLLGLLDSRNSRYLIFRTRFGLHTFFLETPIDVILLDNQNRIVKLKPRLFPNHLFLYHPRYTTVIEMPFGTITKFDLSLNDKIFIE